jgi:concanavalin A-like lectin/glucanase superfamily protein
MDPGTDWVTASRRGLRHAVQFSKNLVEADRNDHVAISRVTVTAAEGNSWGFWFKGTDTAQYPLSRLGHGSSYVNVYSTSYIRWRDRLGKIYSWVSSPNTLDGEWHWICGTQDVNFTRLYVDGKEVTSAVATQAGSYMEWDAIGEHVNGQLSNAVVYKRVLAPNEIRTLHRDPLSLVRRRAMTFPADVTAMPGPFNVAAGLPYVAGSVGGDAYSTGLVAGALT